MKKYQDTETGKIWEFEDGVDPLKLGNGNVPATLTETIVYPPEEQGYVWLNRSWIAISEAPKNYKPPVSSVPTYNPAWVTFLFPPYTMILPTEQVDFRFSFEQVTTKSYDADRLSSVVTSLPLPTKEGCAALISFDGAIAIPRSAGYHTMQHAVDALNRVLCCILIGGQHVEALDFKTIVCGSLQNLRTIFVNNFILHNSFRIKDFSHSEMSVFLNPRYIEAQTLRASYLHGSQVLNALKDVSPIFLLRGYSALLYRNLADALANLWIFTEQIVSILWEREFLSIGARQPKEMPGRRDSLKNDNRTWSMSVRLELLWQTNNLSDECYKALSNARRARNSLAHGGCSPNFSVVVELWNAVIQLLEAASEIKPIRLRNIIAYVQTSTGLSIMSLEQYALLPDFASNAPTNFDEWDCLAKSFD